MVTAIEYWEWRTIAGWIQIILVLVFGGKTDRIEWVEMKMLVASKRKINRFVGFLNKICP